MTKRVMILATDGFEQSELTGPKERLEQAGFETLVVSPEGGEIRGWDQTDWGDKINVDMELADASASDFDALVLPGGQINPDKLRLDEQAVKIVGEFVDADKPVAAICHGPWLLIESGAAKGRRMTSWPSIRTDLRNAGATVVDEEVVTDGNIITSRNPDDVPAFADALINMLNESAASERTTEEVQ